MIKCVVIYVPVYLIILYSHHFMKYSIPGFNCQKNRCKILKYTRVASHDFTQILTAHLLLGILQVVKFKLGNNSTCILI